MLNLSNGTERNHEPGERVATAELEAVLDLAIALVERAGA
jgi:di/tripeptidase